ncbi:MAG: hypothetical protein J6Y62_04570 [Clostridia bacterium]|nr:hypothetical protein [Clostridia bacterium]
MEKQEDVRKLTEKEKQILDRVGAVKGDDYKRIIEYGFGTLVFEKGAGLIAGVYKDGQTIVGAMNKAGKMVRQGINGVFGPSFCAALLDLDEILLCGKRDGCIEDDELTREEVDKFNEAISGMIDIFNEISREEEKIQEQKRIETFGTLYGK